MSAEPLSPPTVLNRTATGVDFPMFSNIFALQYWTMAVEVTSKYPKAPPPFACTTLSGILSLSKAAIESIRAKSFSDMSPRGPFVMLAVMVDIGAPFDDVAPYPRGHLARSDTCFPAKSAILDLFDCDQEADITEDNG